MTITDLNDDLKKLNRSKGNSVFSWNGWTIEKFTPSGRAPFSKDGVFRNGKWGFLTRYEVNDDGTWQV